ncbi:MAG: ABC transporter permease [Bdellovibrionaceae bacterium]|nr:ABC transporter permease [Pseudobdellovibrionaceae bacterium]MBX3034109.1 ABC transporter permease [Pseudobdellovibrionaceae bacterium]
MKFKDCFVPPKITSRFLHVWQRNFLHYRKTWMVSLLWTCLEPLMYLGAIGYGLGSYVSNMGGHSYVEFFFPGILTSTAMMVAFFEGTYGCFAKLNFQKTYATIMMSPVSAEEIVVGEILWTASKGLFGACGVALVASFLGLVDSWRIFPVLLILFGVSWFFAGLAMIVTTWVRNYDAFIYYISGFIIPMSLVSGIYFPIEQLPNGIRHLTWLLPLTHAVSAVRGVLSVGFTWQAFAHVALILFIGWLCMNIAIWRVRNKLVR